jgi:hypothetical protein
MLDSRREQRHIIRHYAQRDDTETRGDGDAAKKQEVEGDSILIAFLLNFGL